jgi:hypothetical protein
MDDEWQLALVHLALTLWAPGKPHVLIGIEKEAVAWGLFAQLCRRFLFSLGHSVSSIPSLPSKWLYIILLQRLRLKFHSIMDRGFLVMVAYSRQGIV